MAVEEHKARAPKNVACFILTVSDTRDQLTDHSGALIKDLLTTGGHLVAGYQIVKDEPGEITSALEACLADQVTRVVIVNGGTGIAARDGTYEVVSALLEKRLDGFGEIFRFLSFQEIGSAAMLSRAVAGVTRGKAIFSLPGSQAAVNLALKRLILPELGHLAAQLHGYEGKS
jgi:molybdopterin adenylyltransferase